MSPSPLLQLHQVSLVTAVGASYLLRNLSFAVYRGDRVAIIGPTGAGKTTLLRLFNRLQEPSSGSIELENVSLRQTAAVQLRRHVVLVPQEPKLLGMTVKDTLFYPLILQGIKQPEQERRVKTWRSHLNIPDAWLERGELQLSLGQRQLVAIARALVMQPKLLLLDEPTSALDAGTAKHLIETLVELTQHSETTIIMVNHQLELARQFANRVLFLQAGQFKKDSPAAELDWESLKTELSKAEAEGVHEWGEVSDS